MSIISSKKPYVRSHGILWVQARLRLWLLMFGLTGCASFAPPFPEVNLADPGWMLWSGQAIWKPNSEGSVIAGDLIAAHHTNGDILVNFSKSPLSILTAQSAGEWWRIDFLERGRSYSGRGEPPQRIIWFSLPDLLKGAPAPNNWIVRSIADGEWSVTNQQTGETIRIVLD